MIYQNKNGRGRCRSPSVRNKEFVLLFDSIIVWHNRREIVILNAAQIYSIYTLPVIKSWCAVCVGRGQEHSFARATSGP